MLVETGLRVTVQRKKLKFSASYHQVDSFVLRFSVMSHVYIFAAPQSSYKCSCIRQLIVFSYSLVLARRQNCSTWRNIWKLQTKRRSFSLSSFPSSSAPVVFTLFFIYFLKHILRTICKTSFILFFLFSVHPFDFYISFSYSFPSSSFFRTIFPSLFFLLPYFLYHSSRGFFLYFPLLSALFIFLCFLLSSFHPFPWLCMVLTDVILLYATKCPSCTNMFRNVMSVLCCRLSQLPSTCPPVQPDGLQRFWLLNFSCFLCVRVCGLLLY